MNYVHRASTTRHTNTTSTWPSTTLTSPMVICITSTSRVCSSVTSSPMALQAAARLTRPLLGINSCSDRVLSYILGYTSTRGFFTFLIIVYIAHVEYACIYVLRRDLTYNLLLLAWHVYSWLTAAVRCFVIRRYKVTICLAHVMRRCCGKTRPRHVFWTYDEVH